MFLFVSIPLLTLESLLVGKAHRDLQFIMYDITQ